MSSSEPVYGDPETRSRILQATWELIEEGGPGVRLVDAADRAGVSRQAVYLHFGDRAGLLLALVQYMPETLGFREQLAYVFDAPTGAEMLERAVKLHSTYTSKIDSVAQVLEAAQYQDEELGAAWRDRMDASRVAHRAIIQRVADEGKLADGWTVDNAGDLFYTVTMNGPWRELTRELGWTPEQYAENLTRMLRRSFLTE
ncbi:MAG TPA: TetR/AcrR family transcriptional regulator [Acidimicrobiia bacterium]|nr:Transcriptional regulator [Acidimicrobiia bacterium]HYJ24450.1 TetR/AcrR family transcriptional regulator [Acidimicrobiia bacterium]